MTKKFECYKNNENRDRHTQKCGHKCSGLEKDTDAAGFFRLTAPSNLGEECEAEKCWLPSSTTDQTGLKFKRGAFTHYIEIGGTNLIIQAGFKKKLDYNHHLQLIVITPAVPLQIVYRSGVYARSFIFDCGLFTRGYMCDLVLHCR